MTIEEEVIIMKDAEEIAEAIILQDREEEQTGQAIASDEDLERAPGKSTPSTRLSNSRLPRKGVAQRTTAVTNPKKSRLSKYVYLGQMTKDL